VGAGFAFGAGTLQCPAMEAAIHVLPCLCFPFAGLLGLALFAFWIWMLVEVATKEPASDSNKVVWILVVALLHGLGAAIYFFVRRPERIRLYGR
jgi:hypothetical protein